jgi:succinoglycan biosynthesis transport protein ExoP
MTVRAETDALMALAAQINERQEAEGGLRGTVAAVLAALWRARGAALAGLGLAVMITVGALSALPPRWTAETRILLEARGTPAPGAAPSANVPLPEQTIASEAQLLLSRGLLEQVAAGLRLEEELAAHPAARGGGAARLAAELSGILRNQLGWTPSAAPPIPDAAARRSAAVDALHAMLSVERAGASRALVLRAVDTSPRRAALIANAAADAFLADQARAKREAAERGAAWLRARLDDLRPRLIRAEGAAEAQRLRGLAERPEGAAARARLADFAAARDGLTGRGAGAEDPRRRALEVAIASLAKEAAAEARAAAALREAEQEAAALRRMRDGFLDRLAEAEAQAGLHRPDARVIAAAAPPRTPSGPVWTPVLALASVLGLIGGGLIFLAREMLLGLPSGPAALARMCGLPIAAATPPVSARFPDLAHDARRRPGGAAAEAGRALRIVALHAAQIAAARRDPLRDAARQGQGARGIVVAVAGAAQGAGASSIAALLAESLVRMGRNVCLVDADLRAPAQAARYELEAETDLLAVLDGEAPLDDALWPTDLPGLTVLPAAPAPPSRGEVLAEAGIEDLINALRMRFDVVVIDAPAPSSAADGRLLAGLADATVVTMRWGRTGRAQARAAMAALASAGANPVAIALTDARGAAAVPVSAWSGRGAKFARFAEGFED